MFLPIGDEPNPPNTAWATLGLIAVNVLVWCFVSLPATQQSVSLDNPLVSEYLSAVREATGQSPWSIISEVTAYDLVIFKWGFRPAHPFFPALLSSLFLHQGWLHLLGNMLYLYIFGDNVEARLGAKRFVAVYLGCGVVATLAYAVVRPSSPLPIIGASGAISGILGLYFVWFPHNKVRVLVTLLIFITTFMVPAHFVLMFYLVVENLLPFVLDASTTGGVAYGAHLGGFVAGVGVALVEAERHGQTPQGTLGALWRTSGLGRLVKRPRGGTQPGGPAPSYATESVEQLLEQKDFAGALRLYDMLDSTAALALPFESLFALADHLTQAGDFARALKMLQRAISGHPFGPQEALAKLHMRAGFLQWRGQRRLAGAKQHFLSALEWQPEGPIAAAARQALLDLEHV